MTLSETVVERKAKEIKLNEAAPVESKRDWKPYQRVAFRITFIFFILMSVPTTPNWYTELANINWTALHYRDIYDLARFSSGFGFVGNSLFGNNLNGYANWIITFLVAIAGGIVWSLLAKKSIKEYHIGYYWLRAIVRYRAGIGIIGFGFTKLFPVQMPYPSEALLNTNFGDFTAQKIYWLSIGIVPWYPGVRRVVELTAGVLLFFRGTAAIGAALLIGALGSITFVNFAYDGGVHVYASYFVLLGSFVLAYYIPRLYSLLIKEQFTIPVDYYPTFSKAWERWGRYTLKVGTSGVFVILLFYLQWVNFLYDPYKQPGLKGVTALRGFYNVAEFKINGKEIPYSPLDSIRWQEATFERWTTLTYKVNKPHALDLSNGGGAAMRDVNRTFEIAGVGGGRRAFYYEADTINRTLYLQDKNTAVLRRGDRDAAFQAGALPNESKIKDDPDWIPKEALANIGDENTRIDERGQSARRTRGIPNERKRDDGRDKMVLTYETTDGSRVILRGTNEKKDSLYIVLDRASKDYALSRSTLDAGKY
ncbi:MAG: hypothetical protein WDO15_01795 [Bacteroidota bacterium]